MHIRGRVRPGLPVLFSSVRSSISRPDLPLTQHHPPFQITPVLDNNIGLSLSEPLQLYQKQSLDSYAGYMYTLWVQQDITRSLEVLNLPSP